MSMTKLDIQKLQTKRGTIKIGGKSIKIGSSSSVQSTSGGTPTQVLAALKALGKINISYDKYATCD